MLQGGAGLPEFLHHCPLSGYPQPGHLRTPLCSSDHTSLSGHRPGTLALSPLSISAYYLLFISLLLVIIIIFSFLLGHIQ